MRSVAVAQGGGSARWGSARCSWALPWSGTTLLPLMGLCVQEAPPVPALGLLHFTL